MKPAARTRVSLAVPIEDKDTETRIKALYTAINAINFRIGFQRGVDGRIGLDSSDLFAKLDAAKALLELMVDEIRRREKTSGNRGQKDAGDHGSA